MDPKDQLWPEHQAGSAPEAHTREDKRQSNNGKIIYLVIDDPRVVFARKIGESLGGNWAKDGSKELVFAGGNRDGFDQVKNIVSQMPYFEVPRSQARYAREELTDLGVQFVVRPRFEGRNGPEDPKVFMVMAPDRATYNEAQMLAFSKSRATADQVAAIEEALENGTLTNEMIAKRLGDGVESSQGYAKINTADELAIAVASEQISIPAANKLISSFLKVKDYPRGEQILKNIDKWMKEGRLNQENAGRFSLDADSLSNLTVEDAYELDQLGKGFIGDRQRAEVKAMVDVGALERWELKGLSKMKWADYMSARQRAHKYMTPELESNFNAMMQGWVEPKHGASDGRKDQSGRYERPVSEDEFRHNSKMAIAEAAAALQQKGYKVTEPQKSGIEAYVVNAAQRFHLIGVNNDSKQYVTLERSGQATDSPYVFTQDVTTALATDRDGLALEGKVITIGGNDKRFINVSSQPTVDAAKSEAQARLVLMDRGLKDAPSVTDAPANDMEAVVQSSVGKYASVLGADKKLYTIPKELLNVANPTLFQEVVIKGAQAAEAPEQQGKELASTVAPKRTTSRTRAS